MYDAGLFDPLDDDDQVNNQSLGLLSFLPSLPPAACLLSRRNQVEFFFAIFV